MAAAVQFSGSRSDAATGARILADFWKRLGLFAANTRRPASPEKQAARQEQLRTVIEQTRGTAFTESDLLAVTNGVICSGKVGILMIVNAVVMSVS